MWLEQIREPGDLRDLSYDDLEELAGEIRDFIVAAVAENAGHLGSNLGVVELTLALHRVFDSPHDALLVGHRAPGLRAQARHRPPCRVRPPSLRRRSVRVPVARGEPARLRRELARLDDPQLRPRPRRRPRPRQRRPSPRRRRHRRRLDDRGHVVRGAQQPRPQRQAGHRRAQRQRAQLRADDLQPDGRPHRARRRAPRRRRSSAASATCSRTSSPTSASTRCTSGASASSRSSCATSRSSATRPSGRSRPSRRRHASSCSRRRSSRRSASATSVPSTGTISATLEPALRNAIELSAEGPIVVHVVTQKGRGYPPAEDDDEKHLHDAPVFDPAVGPPKAVPTGYTQTFAETVIKLAEADDRIVAITAAMPGPTGLLPFQERFPDRFFDVGIAEQHAVTAAAGMAMGGLRPIVAIYSTFLNRAWDQVVYDVVAAPAPGAVLHRPRRHHRSRRPEPPRRVRHGDARQGAGDARARPVERAGAAGDAGRRRAARRRGPGGDPLPAWPRPPGRRARRRRRPRRQMRPPGGRPRAGRLRDRHRQARRGRRTGRRGARRGRHRRHRVGRPLLRPARRRDARRRRRPLAPSSRPRTASARAASGRRSRPGSASCHRAP